MKNNLTQLYNLANTNYQATYMRIARDTILKVASNYPATEYWHNRKLIGDKMQENLNTQLNQVFAGCPSLQLLRIDLPKSYEDSIVNTQVENQNIAMKEFEQQATLIRQNISVAQSDAQAQIKLTNATAKSQAYLIEQNSESKAINNTISNQANVFQNIEDEIGLKGDDLNQYLYMNSLNKQKNAKLLIGMQNSIVNFGNKPIHK